MNSSNDAVSVVIPCFNVAGVLQRQLDALVPQLRGDDEVLLVDNRSTDSTPELIRTLTQNRPRIRGVEALERRGANHARNVGVLAARHCRVLLCDADDEVLPGWVQAFRRALDDKAVVGGAAIPVDAAGHQVGEQRALMRIFDDRPYALSGCVAFRRDHFLRIGGFDESFAGGHDEADFGWRSAAAGVPVGQALHARILYVQRETPRLSYRQYRAYGRTAIQLWARHQDSMRPGSISFKGALRSLGRKIPAGLKVALRRADRTQAEAWGWAVGTVEGHLRYRFFGSPPDPILLVQTVPDSTPK